LAHLLASGLPVRGQQRAIQSEPKLLLHLLQWALFLKIRGYNIAVINWLIRQSVTNSVFSDYLMLHVTKNMMIKSFICLSDPTAVVSKSLYQTFLAKVA
jgi:hypothetical protein